MHFKRSILSLFRKLLYPFGCIYAVVVHIRHFLYDHGWLKSRRFPVPVICVGNLSVGGTGKTPMVLYLIALLKDGYRVATLSRGYKRKTHGFLVADEQTGPDALGDEPFLFHSRFPDITVSVGENRAAAIDALLQSGPANGPDPCGLPRYRRPEVILLDDGFQHRRVRPGFSILLTDYHHRFSKDIFLPAGTLRDSRNAAGRADMVIVTKCPGGLLEEDKIKITRELQRYGPKFVFFSQIQYNEPIALFSHEQPPLLNQDRILLIQGIARPESLREYVRHLDPAFRELSFPDHHDFSTEDIQHIQKTFQELPQGRRMILTTEKDGVKLKHFSNLLGHLPIYLLPIQPAFLFDQKAAFDEVIKQYLQTHK